MKMRGRMVTGEHVEIEHEDMGDPTGRGEYTSVFRTPDGRRLVSTCRWGLSEFRAHYDLATLVHAGIMPDSVETFDGHGWMPYPNKRRPSAKVQFAIDVTEAWLLGHADKSRIDPIVLATIRDLVQAARDKPKAAAPAAPTLKEALASYSPEARKAMHNPAFEVIYAAAEGTVAAKHKGKTVWRVGYTDQNGAERRFSLDSLDIAVPNYKACANNVHFSNAWLSGPYEAAP